MFGLSTELMTKGKLAVKDSIPLRCAFPGHQQKAMVSVSLGHKFAPLLMISRAAIFLSLLTRRV